MNARILLVTTTICTCLAGCAASGVKTAPAWQSMITQVRRRPWNGPRTSGVSLTSRHYRIYTTSTNEILVRYLPGFMEAARRNYLRLTGLADLRSDKKMAIYLMGTRREWVALTRKVVRRNVETYLSIEAGGYCYDKVGVFWDIGGLSTLSVSAHEGLHQFFRYRLRDAIPMWLEEGLCVTAEGYRVDGKFVTFTPSRNASRFNNLRNALTHRQWIPIGRLLPMDAGMAIGGRTTQQAVGYYGQLWALVQFIRSRSDYRKGMVRLLADAEAGRLASALNMPPGALRKLRRYGRAYNRIVSIPLFRRYISDDLATFGKEYRSFSEKLVGLRR